MSKLKRFLVLLLFALVLAPNVYVFIKGAEYFPFSNNPMFGHYVTKQDSLVTLSFITEKDKKKQKLLFEEYNLWVIRVKRFYFSNVYGSSEMGSVQKNPSDTREKFIENNRVFCHKLSKIILAKKDDVDNLFVILERYTSEDVLYQVDSIGYYNIEENKFILL